MRVVTVRLTVILATILTGIFLIAMLRLPFGLTKTGGQLTCARLDPKGSAGTIPTASRALGSPRFCGVATEKPRRVSDGALTNAVPLARIAKDKDVSPALSNPPRRYTAGASLLPEPVYHIRQFADAGIIRPCRDGLR